MAEAKKPSVEPYQFAPPFERALAFFACSSARFYSTTAHVVDPDALGATEARLVVRAAQQIAKEIGHGPGSVAVVLQRLWRAVNEGKLTYEDAVAVANYLDAAEDAGLPREDVVVHEAAPVLRRRLEFHGLKRGLDGWSQRGTQESTIDLLRRAARVGVMDAVGVGTLIGGSHTDASLTDMHRIKNTTRLEMGIPELDGGLLGGAPRGGLTVFAAKTGRGKTFMLSHVAAHNIARNHVVAMATLELPKAEITARVIANLTGFRVDDVFGSRAEEVRPALAAIPNLGVFALEQFTPRVTTMADIFDWVARVEVEVGRPITTLITDYGDRIGAPTTNGKTPGTYEAMGLVFEAHRVYAEQRSLWCFTASQVKTRQKKRDKRGDDVVDDTVLDEDDMSDSANKGRYSSLVVTLNGTDDGLVKFFVAKHSSGPSRFFAGPLPTDFAHGRMIKVGAVANEWGGQD